MPRIVITERAVMDLNCLQKFLSEKDEEAAVRAGRALRTAIDRLAQNPYLGRTLEGDIRGLTVNFGKYGYQIAYRYYNIIYILAIRGGREDALKF